MQVEKGRRQHEERKAGRRLRAGQPKAEDEGSMARLHAMGPEAIDYARTLLVVNMFDMWAECSRPACQRAKACRGEDIDCFIERRPELQRRILQRVFMLLSTANISSDQFYDYLEEVTGDTDDEDDDDFEG